MSLPQPYYQRGPVTLYHGDCLDLLPHLPRVDAVVTDPPYGIGAAKASAHSSIRDNSNWEHRTWDNCRPPAAVFHAILMSAQRVAIWGGNYFADMLPASSGWLCWRKPEAETGFSLADVELCWTNQSFAARTKTLPRRDGNQHPTQKPVSLIEWTFLFLGNPDSVVDPFIGSGTTAVACIRTGRQCIGIELEERYLEIAAKRCDRELDQGRLPFDAPKRPQTQRELFAEAATCR